jgi:hypothetical protein
LERVNPTPTSVELAHVLRDFEARNRYWISIRSVPDNTCKARQEEFPDGRSLVSSQNGPTNPSKVDCHVRAEPVLNVRDIWDLQRAPKTFELGSVEVVVHKVIVFRRPSSDRPEALLQASESAL